MILEWIENWYTWLPGLCRGKQAWWPVGEGRFVCSQTRGCGFKPCVACCHNSVPGSWDWFFGPNLGFRLSTQMLNNKAITWVCKIRVAIYKHSFCSREFATPFSCIVLLISRVTTGWSHNIGPFHSWGNQGWVILGNLWTQLVSGRAIFWTWVFFFLEAKC